MLMREKTLVEKITEWVGSTPSLVVHTILFIVSFALSVDGILSWNRMLLILTTVVSLEAIYLAIFIQMTVNRQAAELAEVGEDIDEIQEDIEEIHEDEEEDEVREMKEAATIEQLSRDLRRVLTELERLKGGKG
jgi:low affinity Fe/Cu permease